MKLLGLILLLRNAWSAIRAFPMQSFLSILATAIGAAAIILIINLGESLKTSVSAFQERENRGSIVIRADASYDELLTGTNADLTVEHGLALAERFPEIGHVTPLLTLGARSRSVTMGADSMDAHVFGTSTNWIWLTRNNMLQGRFLAISDELNASNACVLGFAFRRVPLGAMVDLGGLRCKVVGVLEKRGKIIVDYDAVVIVPLSTARAVLSRLGAGDTELLVSPRQGARLEDILGPVRTRLRQFLNRKPGQSDGFLLIDAKGTEQFLDETLGKATAVLAGLVGIALLVAGLGILSLMLTGVVARTREIGIRRAVGATPADIALQFLTESALIAFLGGCFGVFLAVLVTAGASLGLDILPDIVFSLHGVGYALGSSTLIGIIFGLGPALRAGRLDPVAALSHE